MGDRTGIEWTDATWNPVRGCARVSDGCKHCYAERVAARFSNAGQPYEGLIHASTGGWNGTVKLVPEALQIPWRWVRPRRIFVNSMSDLFHEDVPFEFIAAVFWIMSVTTRHTYQVLTKRPGRMLEFFDWLLEQHDEQYGFELGHSDALFPRGHEERRFRTGDGLYHAAHKVPEVPALGWEPATAARGGYDNCGPAWPPQNVWLGVSVENQAAADERIPLLLQCPAAVRWVSAEPLLGPVDLGWFLQANVWEGTQAVRGADYGYGCRIDWVVAGGESGPDARPLHPAWARQLRDQCAAAGVPFLFKQWGEWRAVSQGPADWYASLYRSRLKAREGENQDDIDDVYGRRCTVPTLCLHSWGEHVEPGAPNAFAAGLDPVLSFKVGKKAAGRELDGVLHDAYPDQRGA